jgi:hypothetical protein
MVFEYKNVAKLARKPNEESLITIEAPNEKVALAKLRWYIQIGVWMGWYKK